MLNGSFIGAGTDTSGAGGSLNITTERTTVAGVGADGQFPSALRTDVGAGLVNSPQPIASGQGGQITLRAHQLRVLDGGQILASTRSSGGRVTVRADGVLGSKVRDRPTPQSDITASSEAGLDGSVSIDLLAPDPHSGLVALPTALLNEDDQIRNACDRYARSRFSPTGRGGLPRNPRQQLLGQVPLLDARAPTALAAESFPNASASPGPAQTRAIAEAQAAVIRPSGQVELVGVRSRPASDQRLSCRSRQEANG